jgi:hypothetical protein
MRFTKVVADVITLAEEVDRSREPGDWYGPPMRPYPWEAPEAEERFDAYLDGLPADVLERVETLMYLGRDRCWLREPRRTDRQQRKAAQGPPPEKGPLVTQIAGKGRCLPEYLRRGLALAARQGIDVDSPW